MTALAGCADFLVPTPAGIEAREPRAIQLDAPALAIDDGSTGQLTATVLDQTGVALTTLPAGSQVSWSSAVDTIASVSPAGLVTGRFPGVTQITASVPSRTGPIRVASQVTVKAVPVSLSVAAGDHQSARVATRLTDDLAVRVLDRHGLGVAGQVAAFAITAGGGTLTAASATTDSTGKASVGYTTGTTAGPAQVDVSVARLAGIVVHFSAAVLAGPPAAFTKIAGDSQTAIITTQVATRPTVRLADAYGNVVSGAAVTWSVASGGGSVPSGSGTTDSIGKASIAWTLGGQPGVQSLQASTAGGSIATLFTATAIPVPVKQVSVSPASGSVTVGATLAFSAATKDSAGGVLSGRTIAWSSSNAAVATIDANGVATGVAAGSATITATSEGIAATATLDVAPVVTPAAATVAANAGGGQTAFVGTAVTTVPSVLVRDQAGNPIAGVSVTFAVASGGGSITGAAAVSNVSGVASVGSWTLGPAAGTNTLTATVTGTGITGNPVTFTATAILVPVKQVSVSPASGSVAAGATLSFSAATKDSAGGVLSGRTITWSSSDQGVATVDANGVATGVAAGSATIMATSEGVSGTATITVTAIALATMQVDIPGPDLIGLALSNPLDIHLGAPAPPGGVQLTLTSDNAGIVVPAQATVSLPAGDTIARVTLNGLALGSTTVHVTAPGYSPASLAVNVTDQVVSITPVSYEVGYFGTCAIGNGGVVTCWGQAHGATPVQEPGSGWVAFSLGDGHQCALTALGAAWCWGDNSRGQLGNGSFSNSATPVPVAGGHTFARIIAGFDGTCGLTTSGAVYCWGQDPFGLLGNGTAGDKNTPMEAAGHHTFRAFTSGFMTMCGLTTGDEPYCWGNSSSGAVGDGGASSATGIVPAPVQVGGGHHFSEISTGGSSWQTCAIEKSDGSVWCFGQNSEGELGLPQSFGGTFTPVQIPGLTLATLSTRNNGFHVCGLTAAGSAICWGLNDKGQVGNGTLTNAFGPATVSGGHTFVSIAAGTSHTCAATAGGVIYCWGSGSAIGDGISTPHLVPTAILQGAATTLSFTTQPSSVQVAQPISPAIVVTATDAFGGAPSSGSVTLSFGRNATGSAVLGGTLTRSLVSGVATFNDITVSDVATAYSIKATSSNGLSVTSDFFDVTAPPPPPVTATLDIHGADVVGPGRTTRLDVKLGAPTPADITFTLTSDATSIVSLAAGTVFIAAGDSIGSVTLNGVALGSTTIRANATGVTEATLVVQVSNTILLMTPVVVAVGAIHTCTLRSGTAYCWGWNSKGQLGDGTTADHSTPAVAASGHTFVSLTAGSQFTCGLKSDGSAWCWGDNTFGELGNGNNTSSSSPVAVSGGHQFVRFARLYSNGAGICALTGGGEVWCWGVSQVLGNSSFASSNVPVLLPFNRTWIDVAVAGSSGACGVTSVGDVQCWAALQQLNGFQGAPLSRAVATGNGFTCMLDEVGKPWCVGSSLTGALGLGPGITGASFPTPVVGSEVFTSLSNGLFSMCGLASGGAAYCWGSGADGEIGDGFTSNRFSPTAVSGGLAFTEIHGDATVCGATATGEVWCWGNNNIGQIGDGTTTNRLVPVKIF